MSLRLLRIALIVTSLFGPVSMTRLAGEERAAIPEPKASPSTPPQPGSPQIAEWIQKLDSDSYAERQTAMRNLRRSGIAAVAALAKAAQGSSPEVTARAIELLTQLYESPDGAVAIAADDALELLSEAGSPNAVVRTNDAFATVLSRLRRKHAIDSIRRLGGHVIPRPEHDENGQEIESDLAEEGTIQSVVLGKRWTGSLDGLKYLLRLKELPGRTLFLTKEVPFSEGEREQLKVMLPGVRIEPRGSAYLGITSLIQRDPDLCIIHTVVPNSPAKAAGLIPGDLITHVDGLPIRTFHDLTENLSVKRGGEVVYLEVLRGDDSVDIEVKLGEW